VFRIQKVLSALDIPAHGESEALHRCAEVSALTTFGYAGPMPPGFGGFGGMTFIQVRRMLFNASVPGLLPVFTSSAVT
jgi:hypothetical protein